MALDQIHLRKLLKLMFLSPNKLQSEIRQDIRNERSRAVGINQSGGDFHGPFWADAKRHAFAEVDLHLSVEERIEANRSRERLYPLLRDGFLVWWNERRRWTNEPFQQGPELKSLFSFSDLDAAVRVEGLLSVRDGLNVEHAVYPYFAEDPTLTEHSARLGLWVLTNSLPAIPADEIRILDVIRGRTFSLDRTPLEGDEEEDFRRRYFDILRQRDVLLSEYD